MRERDGEEGKEEASQNFRRTFKRFDSKIIFFHAAV